MIIEPDEDGVSRVFGIIGVILIHDDNKVILVSGHNRSIATKHHLEVLESVADVYARVMELGLSYTDELVVRALEHGCDVPEVVREKLIQSILSNDKVVLIERLIEIGFTELEKYIL